MFDEMSFLFETSNNVSNQFNTNQDVSRENLGNVSQVKNTNNSAQTVNNKIEYDEKDKTWKFNKYTITKSTLDNYIKSSVNAAYKSSGKNPYITLLESFNGEGNNPKSLKLKATDFSYLRDIGVFPIAISNILTGRIVPVKIKRCRPCLIIQCVSKTIALGITGVIKSRLICSKVYGFVIKGRLTEHLFPKMVIPGALIRCVYGGNIGTVGTSRTISLILKDYIPSLGIVFMSTAGF